MEALECDVARPICLVLFPVADIGYTLCNVANDGRLNLDGLHENQWQRVGEQSKKHLCSIGNGSVPLPQTCSYESSTSDRMITWIPRHVDCCGQ